jgi:hypothetical protein
VATAFRINSSILDGREQHILDPLPYLPLLEQRPGAGSAPMRQIRRHLPLATHWTEAGLIGDEQRLRRDSFMFKPVSVHRVRAG